MTGADAPRHVAHGLAGYRLALAAPGFRRLWLAAVVSRAGDAVSFTALPLLALQTTGSAAAVAGLVVVEGVALIAGGAAAQLVVDRVEPRRLLIAVDLGRAAAAAALALAPVYAVALPVAAALAVGTSWFSPVSSALVPRLVGAGSLASANALQWTAGVALQLVAAPGGGALFALVSDRSPFALNAASFVASAAILTRLPRQPGLAAGRGSRGQLRDGLTLLRRVPGLVPLVAMQAVAALAVGATSALLVVLAERADGLDGTGYGLWLAAIGAGALAGPLLVPWLTRLPPARTVPCAYLVRGAGDVGLGLVSSGGVAGALLFVYGLNTSSGSVAFQTLVQESVPAALRGRAFALLDVTWQSARLASVSAGGAVAATAGIRPLFVAGGALLAGAGVLGLRTLPPAPGAGSRVPLVDEVAGGPRG